MFRKFGLIFAMAGVLAFAAACGDDDVDIKKDTGGGLKQDGGTKQDKGTTQQDKGTTQQDKGTTKQDGGGTTGDGGLTPKKATSNSGAICSQSKQCPSKEEWCLTLAAGATKGMCLGKCVPDQKNPSNPVNICPVKDSKTQMSLCTLGVKDQSGNIAGYACAWICEATSGGQTKTFKCPDATNYDCKALGSTSTVKVCVPK